jgi:hypothetical protein
VGDVCQVADLQVLAKTPRLLAFLGGPEAGGERPVRGRWLREKDCQLTFSEIVSPNLVEGELLYSNVLLQNFARLRAGSLREGLNPL